MLCGASSWASYFGCGCVTILTWSLWGLQSARVTTLKLGANTSCVYINGVNPAIIRTPVKVIFKVSNKLSCTSQGKTLILFLSGHNERQGEKWKGSHGAGHVTEVTVWRRLLCLLNVSTVYKFTRRRGHCPQNGRNKQITQNKSRKSVSVSTAGELNTEVANITTAPWKAAACSTAGWLASPSYQQGHSLVGNQPAESLCGASWWVLKWEMIRNER